MDLFCPEFHSPHEEAGSFFEKDVKSMKYKVILLIILHIAVSGGWADSALSKSNNSGLGPLELRNQYPVTQQFLSLFPENTDTQKKGSSRLTYQLAVANTFVNTQGGTKQITRAEFNRGLSASDFYDDDSSTTGTDDLVRGYSLYLDAETYRHTLKFRYGLGDSSELSLELPFLSFGGGFMDSWIEGVHDTFGVPNSELRGAYRSLSDRNQYAFYVVKDGAFIYNSEETFETVPGEPVLGWKWRISEGGNVMPSMSLKLAYKAADSKRDGVRKLVHSGGADWGHYLLFSKGYGDWLIYLGDGMTRLGQSNEMASLLKHRFMAIEYRFSKESSFLMQTVTQSSIFPKTHELRSLETNQEQTNFNLIVPTNLVMAGYKLVWNDLIWEMGFAQDYTNYGNETDFVVFIETGMQW